MWIITRTDIEGIINLLEGKIDLYSALRINPRVWKVERNFSGEQTSNYITLDMVDELDWPDQDVYIEEDDGDFDEYLKSLNDSINDNTFTLEENLIAEPCVFEIFRIQGDSCKGEFEFNLNVKPKEFPEDFITERDYFTAA